MWPTALKAGFWRRNSRSARSITCSGVTASILAVSVAMAGTWPKARNCRAIWSARAEATWQDPRDEDRGAPLARRAKRFGSAGVDWAAGRWRLGAEWVGAGPRPDAGVVLGGYGLLNLSAGWTLRPGWTLSARLDNAADKAYTLVQGYNTEGRRVLFTLAFDGT